MCGFRLPESILAVFYSFIFFCFETSREKGECFDSSERWQNVTGHPGIDISTSETSDLAQQTNLV